MTDRPDRSSERQRQTDRKRYREKGEWASRQTERQRDRQTDRGWGCIRFVTKDEHKNVGLCLCFCHTSHPCLSVTSLTQTAEPKMAAITVVLSVATFKRRIVTLKLSQKSGENCCEYIYIFFFSLFPLCLFTSVRRL